MQNQRTRRLARLLLILFVLASALLSSPSEREARAFNCTDCEFEYQLCLDGCSRTGSSAPCRYQCWQHFIACCNSGD